jgi:hypothetical protein
MASSNWPIASTPKPQCQPANSAADGAGDIQRGDFARLRRRPFRADVGDGDAEDAGQKNALQQARDDQLCRALRESHRRGRHYDDERGHQDHALTADTIGEQPGERRSDRHAERTSRDDHAGQRRVRAQPGMQQRHQRLRRIQAQKRRGAGEHHGDAAAIFHSGSACGRSSLAAMLEARARQARLQSFISGLGSCSTLLSLRRVDRTSLPGRRLCRDVQ